jgi:hypothetical protein
MPEQVLTLLERHARRAQPPPKGVFEIVNPNGSKPRRCRSAVFMRIILIKFRRDPASLA